MRTVLLLSILTFMSIGVHIAFAQGNGLVYQPVVQIPGLDPNTQTTDQYVNALYLLAITIAALLAVVKIIFGGVRWMLSDVVTDKASAKKDIWGAILGLLIVLGTVIILNTINPNLTRLNFLQNATPLNITVSNPNGATSDVQTPKEEHSRRTFTRTQTADQRAYIDACPGSTEARGSGAGVVVICYKN